MSGQYRLTFRDAFETAGTTALPCDETGGATVREPLWKRVRRRKNSDEVDRLPRAAPEPSPMSLAGTPPSTETLDDPDEDSMLSLLGGLDGAGDKRAEYAEWVERMKVKRIEKVDRIRDLSGRDDGDDEPTYWSAEAVWEESRRLEGEGDSVVVTRQELLAVLGLSGEATHADVVAMYRRKAKEHHPDRFPDADEATRALHIDQMQRISAAYRALQPGPRA